MKTGFLDCQKEVYGLRPDILTYALMADYHILIVVARGSKERRAENVQQDFSPIGWF